LSPRNLGSGRLRRYSGRQITVSGNFDVAPDGKRFVVLAIPERREDQATLHVTVLLNFLDELRRRLPLARQ
jgi:hypothetical protein